jgi:hypothetical protein
LDIGWPPAQHWQMTGAGATTATGQEQAPLQALARNQRRCLPADFRRRRHQRREPVPLQRRAQGRRRHTHPSPVPSPPFPPFQPTPPMSCGGAANDRSWRLAAPSPGRRRAAPSRRRRSSRWPYGRLWQHLGLGCETQWLAPWMSRTCKRGLINQHGARGRNSREPNREPLRAQLRAQLRGLTLRQCECAGPCPAAKGLLPHMPRMGEKA